MAVRSPLPTFVHGLLIAPQKNNGAAPPKFTFGDDSDNNDANEKNPSRTTTERRRRKKRRATTTTTTTTTTTKAEVENETKTTVETMADETAAKLRQRDSLRNSLQRMQQRRCHVAAAKQAAWLDGKEAQLEQARQRRADVGRRKADLLDGLTSHVEPLQCADCATFFAPVAPPSVTCVTLGQQDLDVLDITRADETLPLLFLAACGADADAVVSIVELTVTDASVCPVKFALVVGACPLLERLTFCNCRFAPNADGLRGVVDDDMDALRSLTMRNSDMALLGCVGRASRLAALVLHARDGTEMLPYDADRLLSFIKLNRDVIAAMSVNTLALNHLFMAASSAATERGVDVPRPLLPHLTHLRIFDAANITAMVIRMAADDFGLLASVRHVWVVTTAVVLQRHRECGEVVASAIALGAAATITADASGEDVGIGADARHALGAVTAVVEALAGVERVRLGGAAVRGDAAAWGMTLQSGAIYACSRADVALRLSNLRVDGRWRRPTVDFTVGKDIVFTVRGAGRAAETAA